MKAQAIRDGVITEADTYREFVTPQLVKAGWRVPPHAIGEQRSFTVGRIIVVGGKVRRGRQKRADYLLYYRRDYPLAVVEAKEVGLPAGIGVQQACEYAKLLGLKFAYATNDHRIIEIDHTAGTERKVNRYATPDELLRWEFVGTWRWRLARVRKPHSSRWTRRDPGPTRVGFGSCQRSLRCLSARPAIQEAALPDRKKWSIE